MPHICPLTRVIPLKLFLDMVPSFFRRYYSRDAWTAEAISPNFRRRNGENIVRVLNSFHSRDVLCTLTRLSVPGFVPLGFRLFCARLAVHYLAVWEAGCTHPPNFSRSTPPPRGGGGWGWRLEACLD